MDIKNYMTAKNISFFVLVILLIYLMIKMTDVFLLIFVQPFNSFLKFMKFSFSMIAIIITPLFLIVANFLYCCKCNCFLGVSYVGV